MNRIFSVAINRIARKRLTLENIQPATASQFVSLATALRLLIVKIK